MWLTEEGRKVKFICQVALVEPIISQALDHFDSEIMKLCSCFLC